MVLVSFAGLVLPNSGEQIIRQCTWDKAKKIETMQRPFESVWAQSDKAHYNENQR